MGIFDKTSGVFKKLMPIASVVGVLGTLAFTVYNGIKSRKQAKELARIQGESAGRSYAYANEEIRQIREKSTKQLREESEEESH